MSFITCGAINKNILYILIAGIGKILAELIYKLDNEIENHPFYLGLASGLGMTLSFIPFVLLKIKSKSIQEERTQRLTSQIGINYEPSDKIQSKNKTQYQKYLLLLLTGLLDFAQKILSYVFIEKVIYNFWIFDMIFLNLFSYFILKSKLYRHQFLTLGLMILLGIAINFIAESQAKFQTYDDSPIEKVSYKNLLLVISIEANFCLSMVINKYLMEYKFCTPYEISFSQGILVSILNSILLLIFTNIEMGKSDEKYIKYKGKEYLDNFFQYNEKINIKEILIFIAIMICRLTFNLFSTISVKHYTPPHVALILLIGEITFIIKDKSDNWCFYVKIVIIIIVAFLLLVFTEMIELNFCGLSRYTRKSIAERADKASGTSDDSNEVDGLEINSNSSSGSDEEKEKDKKNKKYINTENLKPNQEVEFGAY